MNVNVEVFFWLHKNKNTIGMTLMEHETTLAEENV